MELILIVMLVIGVGYFIIRYRNPINPAGRKHVTSYHPASSLTNQRAAKQRSSVREVAWAALNTDTGMAIPLSADVTLTLRGNAAAVREVETYLRTSSHTRFPERALQLALLMARLDVECPEVETWRSKILSTIRRKARSQVSRQSDGNNVALSDPELYNEMINDAEQEALDELEEKPNHWSSLDELSIECPQRLSDDDPFLNYVRHDIEVLNAFNAMWARPGTAVTLRDRGFKEWTRMVDAGLALRGADIPTDALVNLYKVSELNNAIKPTKPIRRKADARLQLTSETAATLPNIRAVFYLKPMPVDVEAAEEAFGWTLTHAKLLLDTVRTFESVLETLQREGSDEESFQVVGDCCKKSIAASDRDPTSRLPSKLPPFHISCEACLERY